MQTKEEKFQILRAKFILLCKEFESDGFSVLALTSFLSEKNDDVQTSMAISGDKRILLGSIVNFMQENDQMAILLKQAVELYGYDENMKSKDKADS